jgi:hypothetical protein
LGIRVAKAAFVVHEVASYEFSRIHGASNLHVARDGWRVLRTIFAERLRVNPSPRQRLPTQPPWRSDGHAHEAGRVGLLSLSSDGAVLDPEAKG